MANFELWERKTLEQFAAEATRKLLENEAEIQRLRRYADAMNGKPGTERHVYNGACPDNGQPDSRDPECPACRLLVPNASVKPPSDSEVGLNSLLEGSAPCR